MSDSIPLPFCALVVIHVNGNVFSLFGMLYLVVSDKKFLPKMLTFQN